PEFHGKYVGYTLVSDTRIGSARVPGRSLQCIQSRPLRNRVDSVTRLELRPPDQFRRSPQYPTAVATSFETVLLVISPHCGDTYSERSALNRTTQQTARHQLVELARNAIGGQCR